MSVPVGKRYTSKSEFDRVYFQIFEDAVRLTEHYFGASKEVREEHARYISVMSDRVLRVVSDIGTNIRMANSIYPQNQSEYEHRQLFQKNAIGLCYDLLTKYQMTMRLCKVKGDKYVNEIKNVIHEINCLKNWRKSDSNRFKDLG